MTEHLQSSTPHAVARGGECDVAPRRQPSLLVHRRGFLGSLVGTVAALATRHAFASPRELGSAVRPPLGKELAFATDAFASSTGNIVLRWGEPLTRTAPDFDFHRQTANAQAEQFGFDGTLVGWFPLPRLVRYTVRHHAGLAPRVSRLLGGAYPSLVTQGFDHALLVMNHAAANAPQMFPDYDPAWPTGSQAGIEMEAMGLSIAEVQFDAALGWHLLRDSRFNRRITATTPIAIAGPLRGHLLMRTPADPDGEVVRGTLANTSGTKTPWGTVLVCERQFNDYFGNWDELRPENGTKRLNQRLPGRNADTPSKWERFDTRFDLANQPNEYNRFGYVVEVDPYDPSAVPRKLTALGRFQHAGAMPQITGTGHVAVYCSDQGSGEYLYKFVSQRRYQPERRPANLRLLDEGTLYVARLSPLASDANAGLGEWLPLAYGVGPLTALNGFGSQAEVLLNARGAADLLGATGLDHAEEIVADTEKAVVYVSLSKTHSDLSPQQPMTERALVIFEDYGDSAALSFRYAVRSNEQEAASSPGQITAGFKHMTEPDVRGRSPHAGCS